MHKELNGGSLDIATRYLIDVIENDTIVQQVETHNIFLNRFLVSYGEGSGSGTGSLAMFRIRLGSGNTPPQITDTGLAAPLWDRFFSEDTVGGRTVTTSGTNDIILTLKYTIPASTAYVGNVSELGLVNASTTSNYVITRALVLDTEGRPIVINKTDLTVLKITVELKFTLTPGAGFTMVPIDKSALHLILQNRGQLHNSGGIFSVLRGALQFSFSPKYVETFGLTTGGYTGNVGENKIFRDPACTPGMPSSDITNNITSINARQNVFSNFRLGTNYYPGKHSYVKGLIFNNHFIMKFPNADFFPDYVIEDIPVGIGDGTQTDFEPPLESWKEGTEVIYVNGVALTRNVDYTCDAHNNRTYLPELFESNDGTWSGGVSDFIIATSYNYPGYALAHIGSCILHKPYFLLSSNNYVPRGIYQFKNDTPIYCDLGVSKPINFAFFGTFTDYSQTTYLEYSTTGNPGVPGDWAVAASCTNVEMSAGAVSKSFETIAARYWRYRTTATNAMSNTISRDSSTEAIRLDSLKGYNVGFGFRGEAIKFTTPPAVDAVITMDVTMDLPMASDNRVVDVASTITV